MLQNKKRDKSPLEENPIKKSTTTPYAIYRDSANCQCKCKYKAAYKCKIENDKFKEPSYFYLCYDHAYAMFKFKNIKELEEKPDPIVYCYEKPCCYLHKIPDEKDPGFFWSRPRDETPCEEKASWKLRGCTENTKDTIYYYCMKHRPKFSTCEELPLKSCCIRDDSKFKIPELSLKKDI